MPPLIVILLAVGTSLSASAHAQSGQVFGCVQGPVGVPTVIISSPSPSAGQAVSITASPGDHSSFPNVVIASSVVAAVNGQVIDITMRGFTFSPAPDHLLGTCGLVVLLALAPGTYTVNFLLDVNAPNPPYLVASSSFVVSTQPNPIPVSDPVVLIVLIATVLLVANHYLPVKRRR